MLRFTDIKTMIQRAKIAFEQYVNFEKCYKGHKGTIYNTRKKYYYDKLTTYQNNLKSYATGGWYVWEGLLEFNNIEGKLIQDRFVICLPKQVTKTEVEALMQFKVDTKKLLNLIVLDVKVIDEFDTGRAILSKGNEDNYFRK